MKNTQQREEEKKEIKTSELIERLAVKYSSPQYGFITQFRNGTGYAADRTADALAMSLWPSRGLHIYGFEIKASRTDWLKELKNPDKADSIAIYCHYWYLVIGSEDIVKEDELPKTWGLIIPHGKGLRVKKEATLNEKAFPFDELMIAGLFRNIADYCIPKELVDIRIENEVDSRVKGWREARDEADEDKEKIKSIVRDFEGKTGLRISTWDKESNKELIEAVKLVLKGNKKIGEIKAKLEKLTGIGDRIGKYVKDELNNYQL